jgi:hypothetical protein
MPAVSGIGHFIEHSGAAVWIGYQRELVVQLIQPCFRYRFNSVLGLSKVRQT